MYSENIPCFFPAGLHLVFQKRPKNEAPSSVFFSGLLIIRGKKSEISRDLKRQIRGENGRFRGIFAGIFGPNFR